MIKRRKNKSHSIIIGSLIIFLGITIPLSKYLYTTYLNKIDEEKIEDFFNETIKEQVITSTDEVPLVQEKQTSSYNYIAVLEIPTISLKRGLVSKEEKSNNVNQNIQILKESNMPDVEKGVFMLAGHSGSGRIAFFHNLHCIKHHDLVYIYYNNIKYIYQVVDQYIETKDGDISIYRDKSKTTLVLTTCSQENKGSQFVVIAELIDKENY